MAVEKNWLNKRLIFLNEDNKTKEKTNHIHLKKTRNWFIFKRKLKDRSFKNNFSYLIQNLKYQRISPMELICVKMWKNSRDNGSFFCL